MEHRIGSSINDADQTDRDQYVSEPYTTVRPCVRVLQRVPGPLEAAVVSSSLGSGVVAVSGSVVISIERRKEQIG